MSQDLKKISGVTEAILRSDSIFSNVTLQWASLRRFSEIKRMIAKIGKPVFGVLFLMRYSKTTACADIPA